MDLIRLFTGGEIGITTDEIHHMPIQQRLALFGLLTGMTDNTNCIVSGVNATIQPGTSITVQTGFVFLNGELLQVNAGVIPTDPNVSGDNYRFEKVSSDGSSPEWDRNYRDNSSHNILQENRAVPVNVGTIGPSDLNAVSGLKLYDIVAAQSDWNEADTNSPSFIQNKPSLGVVSARCVFNLGNISATPPPPVLESGSINVDTVANITSTDANVVIYQINFDNDIPGNYQPLVTLRSNGTRELDATAFAVAANLTQSSVQVVVRETAEFLQNLSLMLTILS